MKPGPGFAHNESCNSGERLQKEMLLMRHMQQGSTLGTTPVHPRHHRPRNERSEGQASHNSSQKRKEEASSNPSAAAGPATATTAVTFFLEQAQRYCPGADPEVYEVLRNVYVGAGINSRLPDNEVVRRINVDFWESEKGAVVSKSRLYRKDGKRILAIDVTPEDLSLPCEYHLPLLIFDPFGVADDDAIEGVDSLLM